MDWKPYYRAECAARGARREIEAWLVPDSRVRSAVARRNVVSFPHTALRYAGPLLAKTAEALVGTPGVQRVLALGVLHSSGLEAYRTALDPSASSSHRAEAFAATRGVYLPRGNGQETPFGLLPAWGAPEADVVRIDRAGLLLGAEFSLDTFQSVLRAAADALGRRPLPTLSAYVGMTRDPISGSFETAEAVAEWVRSHADPSTAVVATGDLVHYGAAYGGEWLPGKPASVEVLHSALESEVGRVLATAFAERDWAAAYTISRERLGNDQREMLAVLSSVLGPGASGSLLEFDLSDYASILAVPPPCVVASALAVYDRAS